MKFIHCSDLHLGRRPVGGVGTYSEKRYDDYFDAFEQVVTLTIKEQADALLIAGDLFDRRELDPEILGRTEKILQKLSDAHIEVVVIEGNHDNITATKEHTSWLIYLEKKGAIRRPYFTVSRDEENDTLSYSFTPVSVKGTDIYGLGYPGSLVDEVTLAFNEYLKEQKITHIFRTGLWEADSENADSLRLITQLKKSGSLKSIYFNVRGVQVHSRTLNRLSHTTVEILQVVYE